MPDCCNRWRMTSPKPGFCCSACCKAACAWLGGGGVCAPANTGSHANNSAPTKSVRGAGCGVLPVRRVRVQRQGLIRGRKLGPKSEKDKGLGLTGLQQPRHRDETAVH